MFEKKKRLIYPVLSIAIGLVVAGVISIWAPYPYIHDTDVFRHTFFVNKILVGEIFLGQPGYTSFFHYLVALVAYITGQADNPYIIFWASRFVIFPAYALGIYLFINEVVKNKKLALLAAILAPLVTIEYLSIINFAPKILSLVLLPYLLFLAAKKGAKWYVILITALLSLMIHLYMGAVNILIVFSWLFFKKYFNKKIIYLFCLLGGLFILLQAMGILNLDMLALSITGETDLRTYNFAFNLQKLLEYFPVLLLVMIAIAAFLKRNDKLIISFLPSFVVVLIAYFLPLNSSFRVLASVIPVIILFIIIFINDFKLLIKNKYWQKVFIVVSVIALLICFTMPYYNKIKKWTGIKENNNKFTIVSPTEYEVGFWLRDNIDYPIIIVSDPVNNIALASLSGQEAYFDNEKAINKIFTEKDPKKVNSYLNSFSKEVFVYIDGRTSFWLNNRKDPEVLNAPNQAKKFKEFKGWDKFLNQEYFEIVKQQEGEYYIFKAL